MGTYKHATMNPPNPPTLHESKPSHESNQHWCKPPNPLNPPMIQSNSKSHKREKEKIPEIFSSTILHPRNLKLQDPVSFAGIYHGKALCKQEIVSQSTRAIVSGSSRTGGITGLSWDYQLVRNFG
ncbi:hypothetical protein SLA2020_274460 [Shorea laevis]